MFLDSGDGPVFKGASGNYYLYGHEELSLKPLVAQAIAAYKEKREHREPPREVFIHGKVSSHREEWEVFRDVVGPGINILGVKPPESRVRPARMAGR